MPASELQTVIEADLFDPREKVACSAAVACGGILYRVRGAHDGVFVAHLPLAHGSVGPYVVLCIGVLCVAAERLAIEHRLLDIVLIIAEDTPRFELRADGRRCWSVPSDKVEERHRLAMAGKMPPFLLEFVFPREEPQPASVVEVEEVSPWLA